MIVLKVLGFAVILLLILAVALGAARFVGIVGYVLAKLTGGRRLHPPRVAPDVRVMLAPWLARTISFGHDAITLGTTILCSETPTHKLLAHEGYHVAEWRSMGWGFLVRYFWTERKLKYREKTSEREAYAFSAGFPDTSAMDA